MPPEETPVTDAADERSLTALHVALEAVAAEPARPLQFFVYIVESPSAVDLYQGRSEGHLLQAALRLDGIPAVTRTAISLAAFKAALYTGLREEMKEHPSLIPILHVSAHGGEEGLQLADETIITWSELRALLLPHPTRHPSPSRWQVFLSPSARRTTSPGRRRLHLLPHKRRRRQPPSRPIR